MDYFRVQLQENCVFGRSTFLINPFTPKGFPFDEENRLALGRVKSISALWAPTGMKRLSPNNLNWNGCK